MAERGSYPRGIDAGLARQLDLLRRRGHAGGQISQHRSLLTMAENRGRMVTAIFIALGFTLIWILAHNALMAGWSRIIAFWWRMLGLDGYVIMGHFHLADFLSFEVPLLRSAAAPFGTGHWVTGGILLVITVLGSLFCRGRMTPYGYLLRAAAFVQLVAQAFFWFIPEKFPYSLSGYFEVMMIAGFFVLPLVPVMLGFIYYIFDHTLLRRIGLTLMVLTHLYLFIPMQFTAHAVVMYHGSELWMPLLFLVFGLPLNVLLFIVFYSWGMSWEGTEDRNDFPYRPAVEAEAEGE